MLVPLLSLFVSFYLILFLKHLGMHLPQYSAAHHKSLPDKPVVNYRGTTGKLKPTISSWFPSEIRSIFPFHQWFSQGWNGYRHHPTTIPTTNSPTLGCRKSLETCLLTFSVLDGYITIGCNGHQKTTPMNAKHLSRWGRSQTQTNRGATQFQNPRFNH